MPYHCVLALKSHARYTRHKSNYLATTMPELELSLPLLLSLLVLTAFVLHSFLPASLFRRRHQTAILSMNSSSSTGSASHLTMTWIYRRKIRGVAWLTARPGRKRNVSIPRQPWRDARKSRRHCCQSRNLSAKTNKRINNKMFSIRLSTIENLWSHSFIFLWDCCQKGKQPGCRTVVLLPVLLEFVLTFRCKTTNLKLFSLRVVLPEASAVGQERLACGFHCNDRCRRSLWLCETPHRKWVVIFDKRDLLFKLAKQKTIWSENPSI